MLCDCADDISGDGSKEWTPEWLQKLGHRFGDDGAFWISYKELLRKYQNFDRTRLFGPDWKVTTIWTTLSVPWTIEYHDTKFAFTLAKPGPVVIVLSQLDDRYFRGLEGKYEFSLAFRVHKGGQDDYLVRTQGSYRMRRSVNVELNLDAGEYLVLVKIDALRYDDTLPPEAVMRNNAKTRREKLLRIGLAYDLAHGKAKIVETVEEKAAREAYEKRKKEKYRDRLRKAIMKEKERAHYFDTKRANTQRRKVQRANERQKAKAEKREAEARKREEERHQAEREEAERREAENHRREAEENRTGNANAANDKETGVGKNSNSKDKEGQVSEAKIEPEASQVTVKAEPQVDGKHGNLEIPEQETSTDAGENTPPTSASGMTSSEISTGDDKTPPARADTTRDTDQSETTLLGDARALESQSSFHTSLEALPENAEQPLQGGESEKDTPGDSKPNNGGLPQMAAVENSEENKTEPDQPRPPRLHPEIEDKVRAIVGTLESWEPFKEELKAILGQADNRAHQGRRRQECGHEPESYTDAESDGSPPPSARVQYHSHERHHQHHQEQHQQQQQQQQQHRQQHHHHHQNRNVLPPPPQQYMPSRGMPPMMGPGGILPPPPPRGDRSDVESARSDGVASVASVSDLSDRELDYHVEERLRMDTLPNPRPGGPPPMIGRQHEDEFEKDPWNAVAVVGLRVYYRISEEDKCADAEIVKLRVIRPNPYELFEDDDEVTKEDEKKKEAGEGGNDETDEAKVLDLDDSAKDATIIG